MKCRIMTIMVLIFSSLVFVMPTSVLAHGEVAKGSPEQINVEGCPLNPDGTEDLDPALLPSLEEITEQVGILASIVVNINEPCDEEWRNIYPSSWAYWANYAVEKADDQQKLRRGEFKLCLTCTGFPVF